MCNSQNDTTTHDDTVECCGLDTDETGSRPPADTWLDDSAVLDTQLPPELQTELGRFVGKESLDTLEEWASDIRRLTGGGSIAVDDLCHASEETDHWGTVDGEQYHFRCFYDAVILAALENRPVDIHTVSPDGTVIDARAVGSDELSVAPAEAVFSFGIATDAYERSGGDPTLQDGYAAICPYVRAFPDNEAYERWATEVPAATVAMPLAGATALAGALVN
jgi:hypothetical protein